MLWSSCPFFFPSMIPRSLSVPANMRNLTFSGPRHSSSFTLILLLAELTFCLAAIVHCVLASPVLQHVQEVRSEETSESLLDFFVLTGPLLRRGEAGEAVASTTLRPEGVPPSSQDPLMGLGPVVSTGQAHSGDITGPDDEQDGDVETSGPNDDTSDDNESEDEEDDSSDPNDTQDDTSPIQTVHDSPDEGSGEDPIDPDDSGSDSPAGDDGEGPSTDNEDTGDEDEDEDENDGDDGDDDDDGDTDADTDTDTDTDDTGDTAASPTNSSSPHRISPGTIAGAVVGSLLAATLAAFLIWLYREKKRRARLTMNGRARVLSLVGGKPRGSSHQGDNNEEEGLPMTALDKFATLTGGDGDLNTHNMAPHPPIPRRIPSTRRPPSWQRLSDHAGEASTARESVSHRISSLFTPRTSRRTSSASTQMDEEIVEEPAQPVPARNRGGSRLSAVSPTQQSIQGSVYPLPAPSRADVR